MSICKSCFKDGFRDYCMPCRRSLFNGARIKAMLPFESPSKGGKEVVYNNINKISISGVQLKFSLFQDKNELILTNSGASHLLKPKPYGPFQLLEEAPANEHLTMQLAKRLFKIPVAANGVIYFKGGDELAYITRRFDLLEEGTKNLQEDFAQLAGRTEENAGKNYKYDSSYEEVAKIMKQFVGAYKPMAELLFRIVLFNFLFSNGDAHLKNFSLVRTSYGDYILSPAYDLMCTALHTPGERDLALENGLYDGDHLSEGFASYGSYTAIEFKEFANRIGVIPKRADAIIQQYSTQQEKVRNMIQQSFLSPSTQEIYLKYFLAKVSCLYKPNS